MENLFNTGDRDAILKRMSSLQPSSSRQWGKMDVAQMLAHCAVAFDVPCGDLVRKQAFMGRLIGPFVKKSLMSGKPMMRNAPAPPDFKVVNERDFAGLPGRATAHREPPPLRMPSERLDALGEVFHAAKQLAGGGLPERDFMVAAGRELLAVGGD